MTETNAINARLLEIQRMSTEDGPGIRTTVFLKGCSLHCSWCHNPESISPASQLYWIRTNCMGCQLCVEACPNKALSYTDNQIVIDRTLCEACGICVEECPTGALEIWGDEVTVDELAEEVLKDKIYFEKSGGGVTVSGGEPALQAGFVAAFLKKMKENGIHTAVDTCGQASPAAYEKMLPYTDLLLFDIKEIDSRKHQEFTGSHNEKILNNLLTISEWMKVHGLPKALWIRTPVIPDATDTEENIAGIGRFLAENGLHPDRWELCAFNNLCNDKYQRLGISWKFEKYGLLEEEKLNRLTTVAKSSGVNSEVVLWTGSAKTKEKIIKNTGNRSQPVDYCRITGLPDEE
ncbi:glycyl-radical enzyme activating protein [Candidatus Sulfidibacterium hydrothermale]|uniref:glycyl-radical enzyme activating protein n=1 Tax=Candidatus Sulfidibacterium hydrothermale TaxID=2875962 RepID=UPI001F0A2129|nr:glycyl-radical enzyme activating protein [Candidatus Sulfidibacterium hydrothermale]UBM63138.1 glycyl-radical enzyme activating protein [Candidatus Sulfidibacterium hydrothermale]